MCNPFYTGNPLTGTLACNEDPDEMPHYADFYQGLHCLLKQNQSLNSERNKILFLEIITCDPLIYKMDHPDLAVSNFTENSIGPKWVK